MNRGRPVHAAALVALLSSAGTARAAVGGPFGVGLPDGGPPPLAGPLGRLFGTLVLWQAALTRALTAAVEAARHDPRALGALVGVAFVYGLVHAAAPGHGKTLLAAYAVAGRKTLRQAATLAAVAAAAQAAGAIALVGAADALLHLTSATMTRTAFAFQVGSSLVVAALGLWLLAGKLLPAAIPRAADCEPAGASRFAATPGPRGGLGGLWDRLRYGAGEAAERCACGAIHAALPELAAGSLDLRKAASAVLAVALRPCTGALIALAFAMSLHAFWIGAAAAVAMGAGVATALVGLLALTLGARGAAGLARRKPGPWARGAARTLEIAAAAAMVLFGLVGALAGLHAALT